MFRVYILTTLYLFSLICGKTRSATDFFSNRCKSETGDVGECKLLWECETIHRILMKTNRTWNDIESVQKSHCGYMRRDPMVCCPPKSADDIACTSSTGKIGTCMPAGLCPHSTSTTSGSNQDSGCTGKHDVCCVNAITKRMTDNIPRDIGDEHEPCPATVEPPDLFSKCCGIDATAASRIFGGTATRVDEYPWVVAIQYETTVDNRRVKRNYCGGALISGKYVLTAAHCVSGDITRVAKPINVILGEYDIDHEGPDCVTIFDGSTDCSDGAIVREIESITPHPEFRNLRNDIALIRLKELVQYTDFIKPLCLPNKDFTLDPPNNFTMYVSGWGFTEEGKESNIKLHVGLPFVSRKDCQPFFIYERGRLQLWDGHICAGGEQGKDSCRGDSGSPLMFQHNDIYQAVGVVSFGQLECGQIPSIFTNVYKYDSWIRNTIRP